MSELEGTTATVPDDGSLDQQPIEQNPFERPEDTRSMGEQMSQSAQPAQAPVAPVAQAAPQQAQPVWDGQQFTLKYRDQSVVPKSREELISLAQKGFSYSQEMEQLNKQKQSYQQYEQLDALLKSNPAMAQKFIEVINEQAAQAAQPPEETAQQQSYVPPELLQRINYLEQHHQTLIEKDQDDKLNREIDDLKSKYPDGGWEAIPGQESMETKLLRFALDNNMSNLDYAYRVLNWDNVKTNSKAEGLKAAKEQRQAQHQAGVVTTGQRAPVAPPTKQYTQGSSYNDLAKLMAEEMR